MLVELIGSAGCGKSSVARRVDRALAERGCDRLGFDELEEAGRRFGERRIKRRGAFGKAWMLAPTVVRHPVFVAAVYALALLHGAPRAPRVRHANRALAHVRMLERIARGDRVVLVHEGFFQMLWSMTVESAALRGRPLIRFLLRRYRRMLAPVGILFCIGDEAARERVFQRVAGHRFSASSSAARREAFPKWLAYHRAIVALAPADLVVARVDATQPIEPLAREVGDIVLRVTAACRSDGPETARGPTLHGAGAGR